MAFSGRLEIRSSHTYLAPSTEGTQNTQATSIQQHSSDYSSGTGTNQATHAYSKTESDASAITYDLNAGTLADQVGRAISFTKLNVMVIRNTHATASLTVGDGASNPLSPFGTAGDVVVIPAGGVLALEWPAGKTVDSTHKTVKVTPSAAATWQVQFVGSQP